MSAPAGPLPIDGAVTIVGTSLAGWRAAQALRNEGFQGRVVMVGAEPHLPYDRPPLSKQVLAGKWPPERTALTTFDQLADLGIELRAGRRATALDVEARRVELDDGSSLQADAVVLATGAHPRRLPGTDELENLVTLRTIEDCLELRRQIAEAGEGCRVVVVGAGFIGSEVASTCRDLGCDVLVLEALETPLELALGPRVGAACAALHREGGVELRTAVAVTGFDAPTKTVLLSDGTSVRADVVVVGIGVVPTVDWLDGSGLRIDNGVVCDASLFAADGVVAAGDVARWPLEDELVRIEHWQVAADMGLFAARGLLAGRKAAEPFEPVPYFWSDQYGVKIQMIGHPRPDDEVEIVDGSFESRRFVVLYGRNGRLTGALGVGRPAVLMSYRPLLAAHASWDEALALRS